MISGGGSSKIVSWTDRDENELRGVIPSKTHRFWPVCLLPMENFATFLYVSVLFTFSPFSSSEF